MTPRLSRGARVHIRCTTTDPCQARPGPGRTPHTTAALARLGTCPRDIPHTTTAPSHPGTCPQGTYCTKENLRSRWPRQNSRGHTLCTKAYQLVSDNDRPRMPCIRTAPSHPGAYLPGNPRTNHQRQGTCLCRKTLERAPAPVPARPISTCSAVPFRFAAWYRSRRQRAIYSVELWCGVTVLWWGKIKEIDLP